MLTVIYKFYLEKSQEEIYKECWYKVTNYFIKNHEAIGSCLHKGEDNLWVACSRWPSREMHDAVWSSHSILGHFPISLKKFA